MGKEVRNALHAKGKDVITWEVKVNDQSREGSKDGKGGLKRGCNVLEKTSN
jgi:hypothetical protein